MTVPEPETLEEAVLCANIGLQSIQEMVGLEVVADARVRFPRGFLRTSGEGRQLFSFINRQPLQTNLAYATQLADVYTWMLTRTDITNIARDMLVKSFMALAGGIAEALLVNHYVGQTGWRQNFASRARRLADDSVINGRLRDELLWLWDMRCRQHVFEITDSEFYAYTPDDFPRSRAALNDLICALAQAAGSGITCRPV